MKLPILNQRPLIALASVTAILSSSFAQDDDSTFELDPFMVTATEGYTATNTISGTAMNTPLIDVPMTINVITSDFLEDSLVGNFNEAMDYNTSITQTNRQPISNRNAIFAIRGFRNRNNLVDGVLGGDFVPTAMIDRIEVVKGPNTLYGQSDPGGLINVITKTPKAVEGGTFGIKMGDNGWEESVLDYTSRQMDDKLGLRFLHNYRSWDGWRPVGGSTSKFMGVSGEYDLSEQTDLIFNVGDSSEKGIPVQRATWSFERIPTDLNGDGDTDDTVDQVVEASARYNNTFIPKDYTTATIHNLYDQENYYLSLGVRHRFNDNVNLQYKYNLNQAELDVDFREYNTFSPAGTAGGNFTTGTFWDRSDVHTLNTSIRFGSDQVRHNMLFGIRKAEAAHKSASHRLRSVNAAESAIMDDIEARTGKSIRRTLTKNDIIAGKQIWLDDVPSVAELLSLAPRTNQNARNDNETQTIYLTDNVFLLDNRLNLLFGVRNVDIDQSSTLLGGATASQLSASDTSLQFGAVYDLTPSISVFGNIAEAFNPNTAVNDDGDLYDPETSDALEVGLKFTDLFNSKVTGSLSLFEIKKSNVVRNDFNPVTFSSDTAITSDKSSGIELELFAKPMKNWDIVYSYSYTDAKVTEALSDALTGLALEGATPHRMSIFNTFSTDNGWRIGGGLVWADGPIQQFGNPVNRLVVEDGYVVVDLFARYTTEIMDRPVTFGLNVDNATDEFFVRSRAATNDARKIILSVSTDL